MNDHPNVGLSLYPSEEWLTFQNRVKTMLERLGSHGRLLVKPTTHWDYLRAFRRLIYLPPGAWGREPAKNSRSYNRAAFRYGAFARLSDHLAILDGIDPRFQTVGPESFDCAGHGLMRDTEEFLDRIGEHLDKTEQIFTPTSVRPPSRSKRTGLASLPKDWREQVWSAVPVHARFRDAIAVMSVIGPRPVEFTEGVRVRLAADRHTLLFLVRGAKLGKQQGQPFRQIRSACDRPEAAHLRALCILSGGSIVVRSNGNPARLYDSVSNFGSSVFPLHQYSVSPYSYRHQLAADMKSENTDRVRISGVLGHRSTKTASYYGWKVPGAGKRRPAVSSGVIGVKASDPIMLHVAYPFPKGNGSDSKIASS